MWGQGSVSGQAWAFPQGLVSVREWETVWELGTESARVLVSVWELVWAWGLHRHKGADPTSKYNRPQRIQ